MLQTKNKVAKKSHRKSNLLLLYGLEVTFEPVSNGKGPKINAGTYETIDVIVGLTGNADDGNIKN